MTNTIVNGKDHTIYTIVTLLKDKLHDIITNIGGGAFTLLERKNPLALQLPILLRNYIIDGFSLLLGIVDPYKILTISLLPS